MMESTKMPFSRLVGMIFSIKFPSGKSKTFFRLTHFSKTKKSTSLPPCGARSVHWGVLWGRQGDSRHPCVSLGQVSAFIQVKMPTSESRPHSSESGLHQLHASRKNERPWQAIEG